MMTLAEIKNTTPVNPTKAVKAADAYRDAMNLEREKVVAPDYSCVVYIYTTKTGRHCFVGYAGRSKKAAIHYGYSTAEQRDERAAEWIISQMERKEARKPAARALEVGDVLRSVWGYDQTNVDYYMVTNLIGQNTVELVEIGCEAVDTGMMQGVSVPDKSRIISEPFNRRANGNRVRINEVASASKMEPKRIAGVEIYDATNWSSYA